MTTADELLKALDGRGLEIVVNESGQPVLRGNRGRISEEILEALAAYREEIIARFKLKPRREFLWPGTGCTEVDKLNMPETWFPAGAWYWRLEGESESEWKLIPGVRNAPEIA